MFQNFFELILLLFNVFCVVANWRLVDQSFTEDQILNVNTWISKGSCTTSTVSDSPRVGNCNTNQLQYIKLTDDEHYLQKSFFYKSFQVQVILDEVIYSREYDRNDLIQNSEVICKTFINKFELYTIVSNIANFNNDYFKITICLTPRSNDEQIGIRNMLIYVNTCHPTCLTCNGPLETNCLTCYNSQSVVGGKCTCISDQQFSETFLGCIQECNRDNSIARYDKICVQDNRIKSIITLFNNIIPQSSQFRYHPFSFLSDKFHPKNTDLIYENCNGISFIGILQFSEGMLYQINLQESIKFLRMRITFYLFNFQDSSKIEILHNNQTLSRIMKDPSGFQYENLITIFEKNDNCFSSSFILLRVEITFQLLNENPIIILQGQLQQEDEFWGFRNVTIDSGFCQNNCKICFDNSKCLSCETGYQLYKNKCEISCPIHSSNCVDYEDIIQYSRYIAKGFYDLNMTIENINSFYDTATNPSSNYVTGQKFSFLNNKIVLGGLLVWNDGSYIKTWRIQKPHYAMSIYFNFTYGDSYGGQFFYKIGSLSSSFSGPYFNPGGGSNLVGRNNIESTQLHLNNFYDNDLYLEFKCAANTINILQGFCAISDYFIVAHYCPPFCDSCSSSSSCNVWQSGYTSSSCSNNQYLYFNEQTETYTCNNCDQSGYADQFQLQNGICFCKPFTFLQGNVCIQCNKFCEHCFGTSKYDCLSCVQEYHRSIQRNQCLCQPGYQDDEINLPCLPICGDQIIVDEEDCDDGNNDPFDGCHQCQYTCQDECQLCFKGKCYQCKDNYQLIEAINTCISICGDIVIIKNEQCDDGNDNKFDGCYLCQFQCYNHCIHCNQGICYQCDEKNGWYLTGTKCEFICGDGIVAKGQEQCDDSNLYPFDQCNFCEQECSEHCLLCQNEECLRCEKGFQYDQQNKLCIQNCGDNLIVGNEQCEDQIMYYQQICEDCQFKCHHNCQLCNYGKCIQCQFGFILIDNGCEQDCGDGQIVGTEVCDSLFQYINSKCFNCNYNCGYGCLVCNQGICEVCQMGYLLDNYACQPICGDLIIVEPELCDDANLIPYDGCYECTYSCELGCSICQSGQCTEMSQPNEDNNDNYQTTSDCIPDCKLCDNDSQCLACNEYFQLINYLCAPICGDSIVIEGLEECDDGNDQPYDGCYNCEFQCSQGCVECQQHQCTMCDDKFYFLDILTQKCLQINSDQNNQNIDYPITEFQQYTALRCGENQLLINNLCINQCGNGLLANQYEECDDGNTFGGDGCSSFCNMEDSYQCINQEDSLSLCTYIESPDFNLNILSDKASSIQLLELTFTQQVKIQTELAIEDILLFTISPQTKYHLTINSIDNITIYFGYPKYQIQIEFIQPIQDPILQIDIEKSIIQNKFHQDLQIYQKKIILGTPFVLPETKKQQLTSVVQINDVMVYSMVSISSLALLSGNAIMFFNLLDLLQSLSYIKYMQYQFPPHLIEFLNTYTKVSLQPIMNYFQVDQLLVKLNGGTSPNQITQKSNRKISKNALNECYLVNAKSCYFSAIASLITYFLNSLIVSKSVQYFVFTLSNYKKNNVRLLKLIDFFQEKIQKKCLKLKIEYFSLGIYKVYQAILHQLLFSTLLQFPNYKFNNSFEILNSVNAILGLLFILMATFPLLSITSAQIKDLRKWKYFHYESKTQFWAAQCRSFQIYRTLFYILIIVQFINYPEAQSILLSMLSFLHLIYLVKFQPLLSPFELSKLICRELLIMITTGTFLIYSFEFSQDNFMMIGWIHIIMFCTVLASNLFIDIFAQIQKIYLNYLQEKQKRQLEQQKRYYFNHLQGFIVHDYEYKK
ncbi:unnamed protein product [Paramecium pentaurelia]|uniref:EGF-like domain-containing protein n=1 Tax=Paramecium pentaurelia TaxID=43138 RepID=A0A8S1X855_9CILI|nr:unnamed protein product [Paramecium pentaurelia]